SPQPREPPTATNLSSRPRQRKGTSTQPRGILFAAVSRLCGRLTAVGGGKASSELADVIDFMRRHPQKSAFTTDFDGVLTPIRPFGREEPLAHPVRTDL